MKTNLRRYGAIIAFVILAFAFLAMAPSASAVEQQPTQQMVHAPRMDVDVWVNKDEGGVYRPGESMVIYFRASAGAYVLLFNVDTEGYIHLVYPYGPADPTYVDGGRTLRVPSRSDPYTLAADGPPGVEYVVAVASTVPFRDLPWYLSRDEAEGGPHQSESDDSADEPEAGYIVGDPYVGIERIVRRIVPPGREDQTATSETYFYIDRRVEYPRYVCADCHSHPYFFDPYISACSAFDIRVDATWYRYAPIRIGVVRPRYIYRVRPEAPTRYRQGKDQWSSLDGRSALRQRFVPSQDQGLRRGRTTPQQRSVPPEFRDFRSYRPGRFWIGRDEVLKLRGERRPDDNADGRGRVRPKEPPKAPQDTRGKLERRPPPPNRDRGQKPEEKRPPPSRDEGKVKERGQSQERGEPRAKERESRPAPQQQKERARPGGSG